MESFDKSLLAADPNRRPMDASRLGGDVNALNSLVGFLNSPTMATAAGDASKGEQDAALAILATTPDAAAQSEQAAANPRARQPGAALKAAPAAVIANAFDTSRIFYTGRLCVGKDHIAARTGAAVEGFARPLYHLAEHFFGVRVNATEGKGIPGIREFLQAVGQWGRGDVSAEYPLTPARAIFITAIRSLGAAGVLDGTLGVSWANFGQDADLWLNAALVRVAAAGAERNAITNVRFENEFKRLSGEGWLNFHVICAPEEWAARLAKRGLKSDSAALRNTSEKLAANLDKQVINELSRNKNGNKLRVIWNSDKPCPSPRLWTVPQFLACFNVQPQQTEFSGE